LARDILNDVLAMAKKLLASRPFSLRSVGIHASDLCDDGSFEVLDLFSAPEANEKQRALESVMQDIRRRYGPDSCRMASLEAQGELADFDPLGRLHQVHPVGFLKGPI
jgi:hypothetical protein